MDKNQNNDKEKDTRVIEKKMEDKGSSGCVFALLALLLFIGGVYLMVMEEYLFLIGNSLVSSVTLGLIGMGLGAGLFGISSMFFGKVDKLKEEQIKDDTENIKDTLEKF